MPTQAQTLIEQIRDERKLYANTAQRVGRALMELLALIEQGENTYLSKVTADTAQQLTTFLRGIAVSGGIEADTISTPSHISNTSYGGVQTFLKDVVAAAAVESSDFDETAQQGFALRRMENNRYRMLITNLEVWGKAIFNELEIRKLSYVGGNVILSAAGSKIVYVSPLSTDGETITGWKCYLLADDGTTATSNTWAVGDQAKCQTFNIENATTHAAENRYYWRLVTEVSTDTEQIINPRTQEPLFDGQRFQWITLSATDYDTTSTDEPAIGDTIVQMGNRTDTTRQNLIILSTAGDTLSPYITAYMAITQYALPTAKQVFMLSPQKVRFNSSVFEWVAADGTHQAVKNYRGEWAADETPYLYYDEVTHGGQLWLCITGNEAGTSLEPTAENTAAWQLEVAKGEQGDKGDKGDQSLRLELTGDQTLLAVGESVTLEATLYYGDEQVDTSTGWTWRVTRDSGDKEADEAWAAQAKVEAFSGKLTITHTDSASSDDLRQQTAPVAFTVVATKADPTTAIKTIPPDSTDARVSGTRYASVAINRISEDKIKSLFESKQVNK